ncbi:MAG: hypothetical protein NW215_11250 [Hyphomicrobiales bacterium]|nr:hypothetical protein [Hyphomicrobiales bacterium]
MITVEIRDNVLWPQHIEGSSELVGRLIDMSQGHLVELEVDGFKGLWRKMRDGADGRPTPGLKPGNADTAAWWQAQQARRHARIQLREILE